MASLQARHSRSCELGKPWTTFAEATKPLGCTCVPTHHTVLRADVPDKKTGEMRSSLVRTPVGHSRQEATRALDALRGDVARRTYRVVRDITFTEWADQWIAAATIKPNSARVYRQSLKYGTKAFGKAKVRDLGPDDIGRFLDVIRKAHLQRQRPKPGNEPKSISDATLAKHLRQLGACLQAAIPTFATENPVRMLHKSVRPKATRPQAVYYTNAELARLWPELEFRPVVQVLCKFAAMSGARFGELVGLRWGDIDLLNREIHVSRTVVEGAGEQDSTKSGGSRTLDLTPPAAKLLEDWYAESGGGDGLVFEREEGGHLTPHTVHRVLYSALERAGIPRIGERGRKRDFHSFRHTFARIALENGAAIDWTQRQLGHASVTLTIDVYGHWSRSAQKAQAERLADAFTL